MKLVKKLEIIELEFSIDECVMLVNAIRMNYINNVWYSRHEDKKNAFLCNTLKTLATFINIYLEIEKNEAVYI